MEGNLTTKRFKKKKNRTEWDSTLSDVSAYRSTPSELERRHLSHISKNLEAARRDLYDKPKVTGKVICTLQSSLLLQLQQNLK
jgi:hypothetical protein